MMSSYVLDRELLLTACTSARAAPAATNSWIDVNSNTALLGTTVYQRNTESEIRKQMADVRLVHLSTCCQLTFEYN